MHFPLSRGRGGKEGRKKKIVAIQTVAIRIRASGIGAGRAFQADFQIEERDGVDF